MKFCTSFNLTNVEFIHFSELDEEASLRVLSWRNDPAIRCWMMGDDEIAAEDHLAFASRLTGDAKNSYWLAEKDGEEIGVFYLNGIDGINRHAHLGIYAKPGAKGAGSSIIEGGMELVFKIANFRTLKLEVFEKNERAIRFYEKCGFVREGRLRDYVNRDGFQDLLIMGMTRPEWEDRYEI